MTFVFVFALAVALALALTPLAAAGYLRRRYRLDDEPDELHFRATDAGELVAVSRYRPGSGASRRGRPVVLIPGLGSNRAAFVVPVGRRSFVGALTRRGWDVFIVELRGHGRSEGRGLTHDWSFDDHAKEEVPLALEVVREVTGAGPVHLVGHGVGGLLAFAFIVRRGAAEACSLVTIGSSLNYSGTSSWLVPIAEANHRLRIAAAPLGMMSAAGLLFGLTPLDELHVWSPNMAPERARRLRAIGFHTVGSGVLEQLRSAFQPGGLHGADGLAYLPEVERRRMPPALIISGSHDRHCPPEAAARVVRRAGGGPHEHRCFGPDEGTAAGYGHMDLLLGDRAPEEVWPSVSDWLEAHDPAGRPGA